jgi:proteasome beta subunit
MVATDGIVLCTDTRVTAGYLFIAHRSGKKMLKVDDHLAMTIAGGVADAQNIVDVLRYYAGTYKLENKKPIPVKAAARLASNVFFSSRLYPLIADVLVAGKDSDGYSIYNVDLFGSLNLEKCISTGSGSPVAYGVLEAEYNEGLTVEQCIPTAVRAITAAMKRNAGTGDSFDLASITEQGFTELTRQEKAAVLKKVTLE